MEAARPADVHDVGRILELSRQLRAELASRRGGDLWRRTHDPVEHSDAGLRARLGYPDDGVFVGCLDGAVVGYALVRARTLADGSRLATITELYVEPRAREVSVGEALVHAVLAWAAEHGCVGIDATALPGDRVAKSFFESHGFLARRLTMHRPLPAPPPLAAPHHLPATAPPPGDPATSPPATVAIGAIALDQDRLLLVRRGHGPAAGEWSLPGGRLEPGERLHEAVVREVREETGLEVAVDRFVGYVERVGTDPVPYHFVILDFAVTVLDPAQPPRPGGDAAEARWVPLDDLRGLRLVVGLAEFLAEHGLLDD